MKARAGWQRHRTQKFSPSLREAGEGAGGGGPPRWQRIRYCALTQAFRRSSNLPQGFLGEVSERRGRPRGRRQSGGAPPSFTLVEVFPGSE